MFHALFLHIFLCQAIKSALNLFLLASFDDSLSLSLSLSFSLSLSLSLKNARIGRKEGWMTFTKPDLIGD
jgi:hypothetical protein